MSRGRLSRPTLLVASVALAVASCGGGAADTTVSVSDTSAPKPTGVAPAATEVQTTMADPGPRVAGSLSEVRDAVVQIVATGSFADPVDGMQINVPGSGSGFIIDPSGLAVTNNHVVTGAALLQVYLADEPTPYNARVVAVSECSDLAVIDIDGEGFDSLAWSTEPATAGTEIFAAGFPLGDPEYTLLDGIVSKENAFGETSWASVDAVIEHSADTLPGNSGGPIVTADGKVVAVNYAGNDLGQSFAIGPDIAKPVIDVLVTGVDHESIGLNGEIVELDGMSGVWAWSVESGSAADGAGIEPGDFLVAMEEIALGSDGTMSDYCDILRSHTATDTLGIEVFRQATNEVLTGQLNGRPLEVDSSFEVQLDEAVADDATGFEYTSYVEITDESALISVSVPVEWADVDRRGWSSELATGVAEIIGPALSAAPNVAAMSDGWGTPGVFIGASPLIALSVEETLNRFDFSDDCVYDGREPYDDGTYTGLTDVYVDCGPEGSVFLQVIAEPADQSWIASVQIVAITEADLAAADEIFRTFVIQPLAG
jgi:serine protease Do